MWDIEIWGSFLPREGDFSVVKNIPKCSNLWLGELPKTRRKLTFQVWKNTAKKVLWLQYYLTYAKCGFTNQYVIDPQRGMMDRKDVPLEADKPRDLDSDEEDDLANYAASAGQQVSPSVLD
jgi:hypothetical protein